MLPMIALAICITFGTLNGRLFSPAYIYALILIAYPTLTWVYLETLPISEIPSIVPTFTREEKNTFYIFSTLASLALILADTILKQNNHQRFERVETAYHNPILNTAKLANIALVGGLCGYAVINRDVFLSTHIYQALRVSDFSGALLSKLNTFTTIESLFLVNTFLIILLEREKRKLSTILIGTVLIYAMLKVFTGSRLMMAPVILLYFFKKDLLPSRKKTGISRTKFKLVIVGILVAISFVGVNLMRDRSGEANLLKAATEFTHEYLFASISALASVRYVNQDQGPDGVRLLTDGLIAVAPSFLFGGAEEKQKRLEFIRWRESIGGHRAISPVGGYYLPGQVYLMTKSHAGVIVFFFLLGGILVKAEEHFKISNNLNVKLISAQILCFGIVFGIRSELWVYSKLFVQQFIILTFALTFAYYFLAKLTAKSNVLSIR